MPSPNSHKQYISYICALTLMFLSCAGGFRLHAQKISSSFSSSDISEIRAYRTLFRRTLQYKSLADQADLTGKPQPHLRRIISTRYKLSDADNMSLEEAARSYDTDITPIQKQMDQVMKLYRSRFPLNTFRPGTVLTVPSELLDFQNQKDRIALIYRDFLHNSMQQAEFDRLNALLVLDFGGHS